MKPRLKQGKQWERFPLTLATCRGRIRCCIEVLSEVSIWFSYLDISPSNDNGKEARKILGFKYPKVLARNLCEVNVPWYASHEGSYALRCFARGDSIP